MNKTKIPGVLKENNKKYRTIRIRALSGFLNAEEIDTISIAAKKYGSGIICFTSRLNVEIPYVPFDKVKDAVTDLEEAGLVIGGTGASVRAVFACKGVFCPHGNLDTRAAALLVEENFGGRKLPVKFKTAISGCPNNCGRAQLNDLGFIGFNTPETIVEQTCDGCNLCISTCKEDAISFDEPQLKISIDYSLCISCGDCIRACKKGNIISKETGVRAYIGGRAGREIKEGVRYEKDLSPDEIVGFTGKILDYMDSECSGHERLCTHLEKNGFEKLYEYLER
ncbi:nitrite and sulphite reductase 4Fe-4S region [Methanolacinia petrolearia DSM 11571]|uniref:Nitrite and sulphite reductase 4Fe-4S region n=1 Tax=Methanolacinia petrolearia (strain DSM 11571 / OCM 486 / SEBR 4847) TaxID=679926 RepID=E1RDS7_METP4|nr:4Fe-4S dicluster domain-containing protein [Methanolacinia petrolearia]ADN37114.1 nitrite and sulphite reductase 4Fe-4S region [Methanolacinia petrolearia DSM 11571]